MFLSRLVLSVTKLFRSISIPRRRSLMIAMAIILLSSFLVGANVMARRSARDGNLPIQPAKRIVPPSKYSHFVKPANVAAPADVAGSFVTTVPSASFEQVPVAPDSIVSAFGSKFIEPPDRVVVAPPGALPTELGGTTVEVNGRKAGLFFVSSTQINYLMPAETELNRPANVVVKYGTTSSSGTVMMTQVSPAIFTANATGEGVPAANILRVSTNGQIRYEDLKQYSQLAQGFIPKPIDMGPSTDQVFLILYLSGIRQAGGLNGNPTESIRVLMGGIEIAPSFAGPAPGFVGLDQVNVRIPRDENLRGRIINVSVSGLGNTSNLVDIEIAGTSGSPSLQVNASTIPAQAGSPLIINGSGFSPVKTENEVRIAGSLAEVMTATTTQLEVMVPFNVQSGTITVKTMQGGEGKSVTVQPVRTSVSGVVEDSALKPLKGVTVRIFGENITTTTNDNGSFVLAGIPSGFQTIEIDGGTVSTTPPFPRISLTTLVTAGRDNQQTSTIYLTQPNGGSASIGANSLTERDSASQQTAPDQQGVTIKTGDFQLIIPKDIKVTTPDGQSTATIVLTPLENGRTPVALPYGYYSTSIVQITPFDIKLEPGAKLIFPNTDKYPAGTQLELFRYDQGASRFVPVKSTVAVSADGNRIETDTNDVTVTSYYYASLFRNTTTITGRVFESDRKTPVQRALARYRGQEAYTDGTGSYVLRYVTVDEKDISVDISTLRASARVDRVSTKTAQVALNGITIMPDVYLPDTKENRPPTIITQTKVEVTEGRPLNIGIQVTDSDGDRITNVKAEGARFVTIPPPQISSSRGYALMINPGFSDARTDPYIVTITATDALGASSEEKISVFVKDANQTPTATSQSVTLDEDTATTIRLAGSDVDEDRLSFKIVSPPANGVLSGDLPTLTYKPNLNVNGADRFTFVVNDGKVDSAPATVTINIRPINDPPLLTVPGAQTISEGQLLTFPVSAFDPDTGQNVSPTASGLPGGATFTLMETGAQFRWVPLFTQSGSYTISFKAEDNGSPKLSETKEVRITVTDATMLVVPGSQTVNEGQSISFDVSVVPGLPSTVLITLMEKPGGAEFPDVASNFGKFRWTPGAAQAGTYNLTFKATMNSPTATSEMKVVQITVLDVVRDLNQESASYSIFGAAGPLPFSLGDDGDGLGTSLATGDLNGDGVADLAVGAPAANGAGLNNGKVYVFFGRANLTGSLDLAREKADVEILGEAAEDRFGSSLAIGDLNGDGKNDLIIGAPLADSASLPDAGKVYVVFGSFTGDTSDSITKLAGATVIGSQRSLRFGTSVAAAPVSPKTTAAADLIAGAPGFDSTSGSTAVNDVGAVFVIFGSTTLGKTIDLANTAASYTVTGTLAGGEIGTTLAVGNFNGDNLSDFAIGAPLASSNEAKGSGAVYLALGSEGLAGTKNISQASSLMLTGAEGDSLGTSLAMGDLNGDGRADLILSAANASAPGTSRSKVGAVYVVYGAATLQNRSADLTVYGAGANNDEFPDALGKTLTVGDFNGDGIADLAIGAPGADNTDSKRDPIGSVYVIFGARSGLTGIYDLATKAADWTALGADSGDHLGEAAIAIANINASEPADVILGIPKGKSLNNLRTDAGELRIIYGARR